MSDPVVAGDIELYWNELYDKPWQLLVILCGLPLFIIILASLLCTNLRISSSETQGFKSVVLLYIFWIWIYSIAALSVNLDVAVNSVARSNAVKSVAYVRTIYLVSRIIPYYFYLRRFVFVITFSPFLTSLFCFPFFFFFYL